MNKDELIEIVRTGNFSKEHLRQLDQLIGNYPYFALPRFLKLKAMQQMGMEADTLDLSKAAVYSRNRKYLYEWIQGDKGGVERLSGFEGAELEFLDEDSSAAGESFTLLEDDMEMQLGGQEEQGIYEKEETEMEDPEVEDPGAVPVIDPLNDLGDEEESEAEDEDSSMKTEGSSAAEVVGTVEAVTGDEKQNLEFPAGKQLENRSSQESYTGGPNHSTALIEQFLNSEPGVIKADKETSLEGDVSLGSLEEDDSFITDTLARIYVKQGLHAKAIYAYERLSLKYPEKSAYFAAQIEKIKSITNI